LDKGAHISRDRIKELIQDFISASPENTMQGNRCQGFTFYSLESPNHYLLAERVCFRLG